MGIDFIKLILATSKCQRCTKMSIPGARSDASKPSPPTGGAGTGTTRWPLDRLAQKERNTLLTSRVVSWGLNVVMISDWTAKSRVCNIFIDSSSKLHCWQNAWTVPGKWHEGDI